MQPPPLARLCQEPRQQGSPSAAAAQPLQALRWGHAGPRLVPAQHHRAGQLSLFAALHLQLPGVSRVAAGPAAGGKSARLRQRHAWPRRHCMQLNIMHGQDDAATVHGNILNSCVTELQAATGLQAVQHRQWRATQCTGYDRWRRSQQVEAATAGLTVVLGSHAKRSTGEAGTHCPHSPPPRRWQGALTGHRRCPLGPCRGWGCAAWGALLQC